MRPQTLGGLFLLASLALPLRAAHAGQWVVDRYESQGKTESSRLTYFELWDEYEEVPDDVFDIYINDWEDNQNRTSSGAGWGAQASVSWAANNYWTDFTNASYHPQSPPLSTDGSIDCSVHAVLKWERDFIWDYGWDEETWEYYENVYPDPNDNPPSEVYFTERSTISAYKSLGSADGWPLAYDTGSQTLDQITFSASNSLGATLNTSNPTYTFGSSWAYPTASSVRIRKVSAGGDEVTLPDVSFEGELNLDPGYEQYGRFASTSGFWMGTGNVTIGYRVSIPGFNLSSRIKQGHTASDFSDFSQWSSIAAGGVDTDIHKAEVLLQASDSSGPLVGIPISDFPKLKLANETGVEKDVEVDDENGATDQYGRVIAGIVTSGDVTSIAAMASTPPYVYLDTISNSPTTTISHGWGDPVWSMGQNGEKPWDSYFLMFPAGQDHKEWINCRMIFDHGNYDVYPVKPVLGLTEHSMKFIVTRLVIESTNPSTGAVSTLIYTNDPNEWGNWDPEYPGATTIVAIGAEGFDTSAYITFGGMQHDQDGNYKAEMTVKHNPNTRVLDFSLAMQDQGTFYKKN